MVENKKDKNAGRFVGEMGDITFDDEKPTNQAELDWAKKKAEEIERKWKCTRSSMPQ